MQLGSDPATWNVAHCQPEIFDSEHFKLEESLLEALGEIRLHSRVIEKIIRWHQKQNNILEKKGEAEAVSELLGLIAEHSNPAVRLWAIGFAAQLGWVGIRSITKVARSLGVTKAALDKEICAISSLLGLEPSRHMKSNRARLSYKNCQLEKHWRKKTGLDYLRKGELTHKPNA